MKPRSILGFPLVLFLAAAVAPVSVSASQAQPTLVLMHANVIDGFTPQPIHNATIVVRDGRIESVTVGQTKTPDGATVFDLKGRWLLPGLVDAHTHLRDLKTARAILATGVTTVRNLGNDRFIDISVRELNRDGVVDVPDVVAAGYQVNRVMNKKFFLDFPQLSDLMTGVHGSEAVRRIVRALAGRGVNVIKVMATERTALPKAEPLRRVFTDEELSAITDEAHKLGLGVAAHAYGAEGTEAAVRAGVRSIEHGVDLTDRTLATMKERGICFVPTLYEHVTEAADGGPEHSTFVMSRTAAMVPRLRETIARARKAGVMIAAGSDGPGYANDRWIPNEVAELVGVGLTPMEAIKAATSVSAECLMISSRTGAVKAGLEADLIVLADDPLTNVGALREVVLIINNGRVALRRGVF